MRRLFAGVVAVLVLSLLWWQGTRAGGQATFTDAASKGGEISDGLDVAAVRLGSHNGFERLVFDVVFWQGYGPQAGKPADKVGHFTVTPEAAGQFAITLDGFRNFSADLPVFGAQSKVAGLVRRLGEEYEDDSSIALLLTLKPQHCYRMFFLHDPARLVLDIGACDISKPER